MGKLKSLIYTSILSFAVYNLAGNSASAAIINLQNNFSFDDTNLILRDETSGLEWLSLLETRNQSYDTVADRISAGDLAGAGWMFATGSQFNSMVGNWKNPSSPTISSYGKVDHGEGEIDGLIPFIGDTYGAQYLSATTNPIIFGNPSDDHWASGFTGDMFSSSTVFRAMIHDIREDRTFSDYSKAHVEYTARSVANPSAGNYVVRYVSVVPLPPSAILFGTALLGLAGLRRRKRKAA